MKTHDREELIEKIGIKATDRIAEIEEDLEALVQYLTVVKVYKTKGVEFRRLDTSRWKGIEPPNSTQQYE